MSSRISNPQPIISLQHISLSREGRDILSDISLGIDNGDFIAITGPNGGGKTTLLRIILRLLRPDKGSVTYSRQDLKVGYLPQKNMIDAHFPINVKDVVSSGLIGVPDLTPEASKAKVADTLDLVGMSDYANQAIGTLSGGQLQRTLFGRAIISTPELLVLDEPLSYIDKHFEKHFYDIIAAIKPNTTILLVSHEMTKISEMATRHFIIDRTLHECTANHHFIRSECD